MNLSILHQVLKDEPKFRHAQAEQAVFKDLIDDWQLATVFSKDLREQLNQQCPLTIEAELAKSDGADKALIILEDGLKIEAVLIRQKDGRNTVCVSSQAGCPLGCVFCATGLNGFNRNLRADEIVMQVLYFMRLLKAEGRGEKIDNIVFMGMGEPFLNYPEVLKALKWLNDPETFNFGSRRLSISTSGITDGIKKIAGEKMQINLAVSLHAADDVLRSRLMPVNRRYPLEKIFPAVDDYINKTGRKVMFEYVLIKGVNDSVADAEKLAALMTHPLYLVNLIPYNPTGRFQPSSEEAIRAFEKVLKDNNINYTRRQSFGGDISAACGQLAGKSRPTAQSAS
jgi:23S rRNA (adenine2503-C2)-methyltransferase